jgi:hypothetical protein
MAYAMCWRSGEIQVHPRMKKGAIAIAKGLPRKLREEMCGAARHAYDGQTLLVPGIPEADNDEQAFDALVKFIAWRKPSCERKGLTVFEL